MNLTTAGIEQRRAAGNASWAARVERLGEEGALVVWAQVRSKSPGRLSREEASRRAWARLDAARRGRGGHQSRSTPSPAAAVMVAQPWRT